MGIINGEVDNSRFYGEGVNFYSIGELSDKFIKALIGLYKIDSKLIKINDKVESTNFVHGGRPENFEKEYIKTKIFFVDTDEKRFYGEWFVNIDLKSKILEIMGKDSEYRQNIITILGV